MKWLITGAYAFVILVALVVAFDAMSGAFEVAGRAFVVGILVALAAIEIGEAWRKG